MQLEESTKPTISRWIRVVIHLSLIQNDTTTEALMPQLLALLRMNKIRDIEAYWIAATLWNKALDHYAFEPIYSKCPFHISAC